MYIGRIITKNKNFDTLDFVDITSDATKIDNTIPTLIIGRQTAETLYGSENIHVLDKKVGDNVYWTYSKLERRNDFEKDIEKFNNKLFKNLMSQVVYEYISPFTADYTTVKKVLGCLKDSTDKIVYIFDQHLYILYNDTVYGLSFHEMEYVGIRRDKIMSRVFNGKNVKMVQNTNFLSRNMRKLIKDNKIIIPYTYFLKEK